MIKFLQLPTCSLAEFVSSSATSFDVSGFLYNDGVTAVDPADIGDVCYATLEPKTVREELISFTIDSVTSEGVATITAVRGLSQKSPYGTGGASFDHQNGSDFVISNNPGLFNHLAAKDNEETITEQWSFPDPTVDGAPVTKSYYEDTLDTELVHTTGDESIAGEKTFTGAVNVEDAVEDTEPLTKGQSDTIEATNVKLTGNQTIAGVKTFSTSPKVPDATAADEPYTKGQHDADAEAASAVASPTVRGSAKLDTAADDPGDPVALTATADRVGAMAGGVDFGTPSATNKFLTEEYPQGLGVNFGDGSDGDVTISGTTTLTRDMFYNNLIITGTLDTDGYRVFVKDTISGTGTIANNNTNNGGAGQIGGSGAGTAGAGTAGAAKGSGIWKGVAGVAGSAGTDGSPTPSAGTAGISGNKGAAGAVGGNGGNGYLGQVGGTGGAAGANDSTKPIYNIFSALHFAFYSASGTLSQYSLVGGGGGAGGSGRNTYTSGGGGGGSAGSGGVILIFAKRWTGTFTISATGGNGGNGGDGGGTSDAWGGGGGGAGGAGGVVVVLYAVKTWTGSYILTGGNGGTGGIAGGAATTAGQNGGNGATGVYYEYDITTLM